MLFRSSLLLSSPRLTCLVIFEILYPNSSWLPPCHLKFGYRISKTTRWVRLGEDISRLVNRADGEQLEIAFLEMLASDVAIDLNVPGAIMEDIIMSNVDSTTIVTIKRSDNGLWSIHVSQEPAKPD